MAQLVGEYSYSAAARQRAMLWLVLSNVLMVVLLGVIIVRWSELGLGTKALAGLLFVGLLFTARAQLARFTYRCQLWPTEVRIVTAVNTRVISWASIVEVRRMNLPQFGDQQRWACTVLTKSPRGTALPSYLFDNHLEQAEAALQHILRLTPHAQHTNV